MNLPKQDIKYFTGQIIMNIILSIVLIKFGDARLDVFILAQLMYIATGIKTNKGFKASKGFIIVMSLIIGFLLNPIFIWFFGFLTGYIYLKSTRHKQHYVI